MKLPPAAGYLSLVERQETGDNLWKETLVKTVKTGKAGAETSQLLIQSMGS